MLLNQSVDRTLDSSASSLRCAVRAPHRAADALRRLSAEGSSPFFSFKKGGSIIAFCWRSSLRLVYMTIRPKSWLPFFRDGHVRSSPDRIIIHPQSSQLFRFQLLEGQSGQFPSMSSLLRGDDDNDFKV